MKKLIVFIVNAAVLFGTGNATLGAANQESGERIVFITWKCMNPY